MKVLFTERTLKKFWYEIATPLNLLYISLLTLSLILEEWKVEDVSLFFKLNSWRIQELESSLSTCQFGWNSLKK